MYKNKFCSECYLDRLIHESEIYEIPFFVLVSDLNIQVIIDDPKDLLGRAKSKITKRLKLQYSTPISNNVRCSCGNVVKCEHSILVYANGENHAFCNLDCYENFRGNFICQK